MKISAQSSLNANNLFLVTLYHFIFVKNKSQGKFLLMFLQNIEDDFDIWNFVDIFLWYLLFAALNIARSIFVE